MRQAMTMLYKEPVLLHEHSVIDIGDDIEAEGVEENNE